MIKVDFQPGDEVVLRKVNSYLHDLGFRAGKRYRVRDYGRRDRSLNLSDDTLRGMFIRTGSTDVLLAETDERMKPIGLTMAGQAVSKFVPKPVKTKIGTTGEFKLNVSIDTNGITSLRVLADELAQSYRVDYSLVNPFMPVAEPSQEYMERLQAEQERINSERLQQVRDQMIRFEPVSISVPPLQENTVLPMDSRGGAMEGCDCNDCLQLRRQYDEGPDDDIF